MKRVLHLVRSEPAALPPDAVAPSDLVVYIHMPAPPPPAPCFLWRAQAPAGDRPSDHVQVIDSPTLCELLFQADTVVVW